MITTAPGAQIAGRDIPETFADLPNFLTSLAAAGLQDHSCDPADAEALAEFPRRLLSIADVFRSIPESGRLADLTETELLEWLPPRRPEEQVLEQWFRDMVSDRALPPYEGPVLTGGYIPVHNGVPAPRGWQRPWRLRSDDSWEPITKLDMSWPIKVQVELPDYSPPLLRSDGHMTPWLFCMANRLSYAADVITSRTRIYAACKLLIVQRDTPRAPSPKAKTLASKCRGISSESVGAWTIAATYVCKELHTGLVNGGNVLCAQVTTSPSTRLAPQFGRN